jgi:hypothetical protein
MYFLMKKLAIPGNKNLRKKLIFEIPNKDRDRPNYAKNHPDEVNANEDNVGPMKAGHPEP